MVSTILALANCMAGIETIVEKVGLAEKVDIVLIAKVEITKVTKIDVEGSATYSVDEVADTLVNVVLSWTGAKID